MSIRKMIALHPDVQGHVNQPLGDAVHHLMYCARMCLSCADACAAEEMDMTPVHPLCLDCADVCEATGKLGGAPDRVERGGAEGNARSLRPGLRRLRGGVREARPRALQAVRADVPRMRRGLPQRRGEHHAARPKGSRLSRGPCCALTSFLTIMSRFSRDRWSMNRTPSRWSISCWRQTDISPSNSPSCCLPSLVEPAGADDVGALDLGILVGDRQAALVVGLARVGAVQDFGVDEDVRALDRRPLFLAFVDRLRVLQVDDQQPPRDADLDRGKADAGRFVHRLEHVGDQRAAARRRPARPARIWRAARVRELR